jgi:hypothetical protein
MNLKYWRFLNQGEVVWCGDEVYLGHFWVTIDRDEVEAGCRVANNAVVRRVDRKVG